MEIHPQKPIGAVGLLASGNHSGHAITRASLIEREIRFKSDEMETLDFKATWEAGFKDYVPQTEADHCLEKLENAIKGAYVDEGNFENALFDAFAEGLSDSIFVDQDGSRKFIVIKNLVWVEKGSGDWLHQCAIAITTQVTSSGDLGIPEGFGYATYSRHDHSCVFISRRNRRKDGTGSYYNWKVRDSFATVELKRQKTSIVAKVEQKRKRKNGVVKSSTKTVVSPIRQRSGFGALWQTLAYTISDVWTCIARKGAGVSNNGVRKPPTEIPFALLSCSIPGDNVKAEASRYAFGNVLIPDVCGGRFQFNILSNGTFDAENVDKSVNSAAAAYLKVLSFGVNMGNSIKGSALSKKGHFHSMTGRALRFGGTDVTKSFQIVRSPISTSNFGVAGSQAEIWQGLARNVPDHSNVAPGKCLRFSEYGAADRTADLTVLIKCTSKMIHNPLVGSVHAWEALQHIHGRNKQLLEKVLIRVEKTRLGDLNMLMWDLSNSYVDLQPSRYELGQLWGVFCKLVRTTLLPLAAADVVHPDIRVGYDYTANIMVHWSDDEEDDERQMVFVDLDSLVSWEDWQDAASEGYLNPANLNAYDFVWWQCFTVAVMWKQRLGQAHGCRTVQSKFSEHLFPEECTVAEIESLLTSVSNSDWFDPNKALPDEKIFEILSDYLLQEEDQQSE